MPDWAEFHFLRPWWLVILPATVGLFFAVSRREDPVRPWREVIAPELLSHLVVGESRAGTFRPVHLLALLLVLGGLALAGPTWEREAPPTEADRAPVVIALDVSASMNRDDIAPTRLERAKQKARDFIAARVGARTGLVAYAGTAHTVLPPTDDPEVLAHYLEALSTDVMPVAGKNAGAALERAQVLLEGEEVPGAVVFLTDGIESRDRRILADANRSGLDLFALAIGPTQGLAPVEDVVEVVGLTVDASDVADIAAAVRNATGATRDGHTRWRDFGYYLLYPIVALALLGFRRGFGLRWSAAALALLLTGAPAEAHAFTFADLWMTADQQGRYWYAQGDYARAAELFRDPFWRGAACYRAEDLECAVDAWSTLDTPEAFYDLGNARARQRDYHAAIAAYEHALAARPDWEDAQQNLALVKRRLEQPEEEEEDAPPPTFDADDVKFDNKENKGTRGEVDLPGLSDDQIGELWLRGLKSDPADFLRLKFAFQDEAAERSRAEGESR